ncbi:polypyrimidine tract-binding protein 3-like isoform X1 [Ciona intestinalis]
MSLVFLPVPGHPSTVQQVSVPTLACPPSMCIAGPTQLAPQVMFNAGPFEHAIIPTATKRNSDDPSRLGSVDNGAKKIKLDPSQISKVVHLRSLPSDVTDNEVIQLGLSYGHVTNVLMLKGKNQAFLEMEDEEIANQMVSSSGISPPTIRQRIIYVQFSNHKELKTDGSPNQLKTQAILEAMQKRDGGPNHVLRAVIENMLYPITLDVLHTIFSKFGVILKIITFTKSSQFQALIQMADALQSQTAKLSLDGQNIYNGCCTLRIEYSKLSSLNVKFNNDKSRDYTRNDLPSGEASILGTGSALQSMLGGAGLMPSPYQNNIAAAIQHSQLASLANASGALQHLTGTNMAGNSNHMVTQLAAMVGQTSVLHVSNLNEEMITPQVLFILFGVYGDVNRVKIMYQKKSNALVQMNDHQQAQTVIKYLHGVKLYDRPLQIMMSRHNQVQMPREGQEMAKLTQDYSNSPLHRFKKPGSKNFQNIFAPSEVLHLSNIPNDTEENFLRSKFEEVGVVVGFKFFVKDRRMALIQMSSLEEAILCLVNLHNLKLGESNHLRVSFSKGQIN